MKLWRATYNDDDSGSGTVQVWGTSERAVRKLLATARRDGTANYFEHSVQKIEVPSTREALVAFLNRYADVA